jgi:hypothetical protein
VCAAELTAREGFAGEQGNFYIGDHGGHQKRRERPSQEYRLRCC